MNKRGNVGEVTTILVILFSLAIIMVVMAIILGVTRDALVVDDIGDEAKHIINVGGDKYSGLMDFWFMLFLVGLPLISAILAFFNNIHPLFFWLSMILVFVVVMVGASISVFWSELSEDTLLDSYMESMPMANYVLSNFGFYSLFVFVIVAGGTFIKLRTGSGFGGGE